MVVKGIEDLKPVYLIFGKEELLLERALLRLRERIAAVADLDFNFDSFDGDSADAAHIVSAANTIPFASERRLVVVRNVDRMNAAQQAALATYAQDPSPSAVLVLVAKSVPKTAKLYKAVDALGGVAEYESPKRHAYPGWVVDLFAERGRRMSRDGAEALVTAVGRDLRRLESEAEKILAFAGERTSLDRSDVESVVIATAAASVFEFLDAVGAREYGVALELLGDLAEGGESMVGVHAMTIRHLRTLITARALLDRGADRGEIQRELKMGDWQTGKAIDQARRFSLSELSRALRDGAEVEMKLKSSSGDERLVLELWLARLCRKAE